MSTAERIRMQISVSEFAGPKGTACRLGHKRLTTTQQYFSEEFIFKYRNVFAHPPQELGCAAI
jgi:hypothetical protein